MEHVLEWSHRVFNLLPISLETATIVIVLILLQLFVISVAQYHWPLGFLLWKGVDLGFSMFTALVAVSVHAEHMEARKTLTNLHKCWLRTEASVADLVAFRSWALAAGFTVQYISCPAKNVHRLATPYTVYMHALNWCEIFQWWLRLLVSLIRKALILIFFFII